MTVKRKRAPGGNVVWTVGGNSYYWNGPGSRLYVMLGDQLVSIDHPSASGSYETSREAEKAVRRFVVTNDENRDSGDIIMRERKPRKAASRRRKPTISELEEALKRAGGRGAKLVDIERHIKDIVDENSGRRRP